MTPHPERPPSVGQQLKKRREALDLTQGALGAQLSVSVQSISLAETNRATIRRGKRGDWERTLRLKPGTLTRAYTDGTPIETLDASADQAAAGKTSVDPDDPDERVVWEMDLPEDVRRQMIEILRAGKADKRQSA